MTAVSTLEVNLSAVRHNVQRLRYVAPSATRVCAAVKANAYGLGAVPVAKALRDLVDMFAVFTPDEAMELVETVDDPPVLVLMPVHQLPTDVPTERVQFVVHDPAQLTSLLRSAGDVRELRLHVQIDTGMSRGGCDPSELPRIVQAIRETANARLVGLLTHLASANDDTAFTRRQHERFRDSVESVRPMLPSDCILHVANTFGILQSCDFHESMIRPGIGLLGYGSEQMTAPALLPPGELRPALRWASRVIQLKQTEAGTSVGYNLRWTADRPSTIALVPAGYADGYPTQSDPAQPGQRSVAMLLPSAGGAIERFYAPVVGAVNMDQVTLDVTDVADRVQVGTEVELITPDVAAPNHGPTLARLSRISAYELATGIGNRVRRRYVEEV
jgi:alanine racemase